jgi:hypothetical protein
LKVQEGASYVRRGLGIFRIAVRVRYWNFANNSNLIDFEGEYRRQVLIDTGCDCLVGCEYTEASRGGGGVGA